jgi:small-conductance mechanosensitive channel
MSGSLRDVAVQARAIRTRVRVLRRVVSVVLGTLAGGVVLLQFDVVRQFGVSILASAGVAGIVLGLAAQRTLGSLIAGIQLSFTQPIAIGDDVIVENEFGTIEEITLTYVVVKVWDERRLIVPMTRFLEQPFQNWTKTSTELHGTVLLYADYSLPVDALRAEVDRLVTGNARWDGRTKAVHVTNATDRTAEIRVLVSADSGGKLFDLRAELRERLMAWLVRFEDGRYLPRTRIDGVEPLVQRSEREPAPSSERRTTPRHAT